MAAVANSTLLQWNAGTLDVSGACIVLVATEWNATIVQELEQGCRRVLAQYGVGKVETLLVPGAVEIPFAVQRHAALPGKPADAYITLGCVIRGDTPHFEYVCRSVTDGVSQLNLRLPVPVIFGVLTVENEQQALERIGGRHGHKGEEAAITALKMIALNNRISPSNA
ncbi:MAG TPA: 6,7-dimethyl-8-ribityllumazine synthase [Lacibacter sp.]|nr:6,7-dimethyl-8-ribityllumazine synthase [Lacibacter sp.]HMO88979.1 6,7-dimethyl-8-ribityllumazine synthase [Lacibacter sp.]